jgi:formamidopyrimidine-DNA glycosylase
MPELPELEALAEALDPLVSRAPVRDVPTAHFAVVKTATPPLDWLGGHRLTGVARRGKHLLFPSDDDLVLAIHLMTAGKLAYVEPGAKRPPGAPVLVVRFDDEGELIVNERVTRKQVRVRLLPSAELDEEFARLGPEPLDPSFDDAALEAALARGGQLHTLLRDQRAILGIGRAYANEILHAAQLAPFAPADRLTPEERGRLLVAIQTTLTDGIERFRPRGPRMIAKGKTPEVYDIHGHAGEACPRCGSEMQRVSFADHEVVYCPTCQTGGQVYADRRRSRLLK